MKWLAGLFLAPCLASAQIYKCTGPDGKLNLTDRPCASAESAEVVNLPPPPETGLERMLRLEAEKRAAEQAERRAASERFDKAISELSKIKEQLRANLQKRKRHEGLAIGMSSTDVAAHPVWGPPADVNTTTTANMIREQWIYEVDVDNKYERMFLYFHNGQLRSIQD